MKKIWLLLFVVVITVTNILAANGVKSFEVDKSSRIKNIKYGKQSGLFPIVNYRKTSKIPCIYKDKLHVTIRLFEQNNKSYFVIVDVNNLDVKIVEQSLCFYRKSDEKDRYFASSELGSSLYYKLLSYFNVIKNAKDNQGLKDVPNATGAFLSIDMCPSNREIESSLFDAVLKSAKNNEVNLLIAISGLWIITHPEDFSWLQSFSKVKGIKVTWVNHSFSHIYYKNVDPEKNFLLLPNTDIETEILETEKQLIKHGELPSPFFRFPGLMSNKMLVDTLTSYGLIQLGASAWISKLPEDYKVKNGDIVLVHGNGNEIKTSVNRVIKLIQSNQIIWKNLQDELKFISAKIE